MKKISKKTYFLMAVMSAFMGVAACSAENKPEQPSAALSQAKSEMKTLESVAEKDFDKAYADAKKEGKVLMLEFTGSQWCSPCKMLHKYVLNTEEFLKHAKDKLKVVVADFERGGGPVDKSQAQNYIALAEKYSVTGFPTIVLIYPQTGKTEKYVGFQFQTPAELIKKTEDIKK